MLENGTLVKERELLEPIGNGSNGFVPTKDLAIAKKVTNDQLIDEERELQNVETSENSKFHGIRGYLRLFQISRVIAMLALYLYLDQLDLHLKMQTKQKLERLRSAISRRKERASPELG